MPSTILIVAALALLCLGLAPPPAGAIEIHGPFSAHEASQDTPEGAPDGTGQEAAREGAGVTMADAAAEASADTLEPQVLTVRRGDTLIGLLLRAGLRSADAHAAVAAIGPHLAPRDLRPGQELYAFPSSDPARPLAALAIEPAPDRRITVFSNDGGGFTASVEEVERVRHLVRAEGRIENSFYEDLARASVPPPLIMALIRAFSHSVDFQRDIQAGDRFAVMFERWRDPDGELMDHGDVVLAELHAGGKLHRIWRHEQANGRVDWFDENGVSVRRALLRTPLDAARISSGFGMRRHPILGYGRMHQGVDFAAPTGTPVYAAGDGRISFAGTRGGYGTTIVINHTGGTSTLYAHLSAIQRGLRPGSAVRQGQVIGRVGSTGMSTGPHLHFEVRRNDRPMNPAVAQVMPPHRLAGRELAAFERARVRAERQFATLAPGRELAAAE
jgi:murein DD-endopeptidase MepM/ murein hydrolase activator NlpD